MKFQKHYDELVRFAEDAGFPYSEFKRAEKKLFGSAANGEMVDCAEDPDEDQRTIRATLFEWLLTSQQTRTLLHRHGVRLSHGVFPEGFDLSNATVESPIRLHRCDFQQGVLLNAADLQLLSLAGSKIARGSRNYALSADGAKIEGFVFLDQNFKAEGEVRLLGASVGGNLSMKAARLTNTDGDALSADGAKIGGDVFLDQNFKAEGEVRLLGALVGGDLSMRTAQLTNAQGNALSADRAEIGGDVFLDQNFKAEGEVRLVGASVGGNLSMSTARLTNAQGDALSADRAEIGSSVFLDGNFKAEGEVRLVGASVGGDLQMSTARLTNTDGDALSADRAEIGGDVFLDGNFKAEGKVRLVGASVGRNLSMRTAQLTNTDGDALSADRAKIEGNVFLDENFKAEGEVRLLGASVGGDLSMKAARLTNPRGDAFSAESAKIGGHLFLDIGFTAKGRVNLFSATIERSLAFVGASVTSVDPADPNEDAVDLGDATIRGGLYFFNALSESGADLLATIRGRINLRNARIGTLHDWPKRPKDDKSSGEMLHDAPVIALDGCAYERIGRQSPTGAEFRKRWLLLGKKADGGFAPQPYTHLAKVLNEMGHPEDATRMLIERDKRQLEESQLPLADRSARRIFYGLLLGHGYRPWRASLPLIALLLVGWFVFQTGWSEGRFNPATPLVYMSYDSENTQRYPGDEETNYRELTEKEQLPQYPDFSAGIYTLDTLLPIVNLHQEDYWIPAPGFYRGYLWFHIAAGWVFTTIFVAGLAGMVRRPAE